MGKLPKNHKLAYEQDKNQFLFLLVDEKELAEIVEKALQDDVTSLDNLKIYFFEMANQFAMTKLSGYSLCDREIFVGIAYEKLIKGLKYYQKKEDATFKTYVMYLLNQATTDLRRMQGSLRSENFYLTNKQITNWAALVESLSVESVRKHVKYAHVKNNLSMSVWPYSREDAKLLNKELHSYKERKKPEKTFN